MKPHEKGGSGSSRWCSRKRSGKECATPAPNCLIVVDWSPEPCPACQDGEKAPGKEQKRRVMPSQKEQEVRRLEQERIQLEHEYSERRANKRLEGMKIDLSKWPEEYGSLRNFEQANAQGWAVEPEHQGRRLQIARRNSLQEDRGPPR